MIKANFELSKDVEGFEGLYQVSTWGNVRSLDRHVNTMGNSKRLVKGKILKIQVKTGMVDTEKTGITIRLCSTTHNSNGYTRRNYSENDVDYFMTYYDGECYLIPFSECGVKEKKLRFIPPKNGQIKGISFAKDYLAEKILELEEVVE